MRKLLIALGIALLATGTVFATGPTSPDADPVAAVPAPEAAVAAPTTSAIAGTEEPLEITLGDPVQMTGCTAQQNCSNGSTVSCTGWDICEVFSNAVRCDGVTGSCPTACSVSTVCCDGRVVSCSGQETCTKIEGRRVLCDGGASGGGFCPFCKEPI